MYSSEHRSKSHISKPCCCSDRVDISTSKLDIDDDVGSEDTQPPTEYVESARNIDYECEPRFPGVDEALRKSRDDRKAEIGKFERETDELHDECNGKIQNLISTFHSDVERIHAKIDNYKADFCDSPCQKYEEFEATMNATILGEERRRIDDLFRSIEACEGERQSRAARLFARYVDSLRKYFCFDMDNLRVYMNARTRDYNSRSLDRHKEYETIKLKFRQAASEYRQSFGRWLDEIKRDRAGVCYRKVLDDYRKALDLFEKFSTTYFESLHGETELCRLDCLKTLISDAVSRDWDTVAPFAAARLKAQSDELETLINDIDQAVASFLKAYETATSEQLEHVRVRLEKIQLYEGQVDEGEAETIELAKKSFERVRDETQQLFSVRLGGIWLETLAKMRHEGKQALKPWLDLGSPWDAQFESFDKLRQATMAQLELRFERSEMEHEQDSCDRQIATKLRVAENSKKLDEQLQTVEKLFDARVKKYKDDLEEDCKIVKKCRESVKKETVAMLNKLSKFVQAHRPAPSESPKHEDRAQEIHEPMDNAESSLESTTTEVEVDCSIVDYDEHIESELPRIELQMSSLRDWSAKLVANLAEYLSLYESDIMKVVDAWLNKLTDEMTRYYQQRLELVDRQRELVDARVYQVRQQELLSHRSLLDTHKQRVLQSLGEAVNYFPDFSRLLQDYSDRCNRTIAERGPRVKKSLAMIRLLDTVEKYKQECSNKIDHEIENVNQTLSSSVHIIEESNEIFMSQVVSFDDGGNYAGEEITVAKKEIDALEKLLHKDDTGNRQKVTKVAQQASDQLNDISKKFVDVLSATLDKFQLVESIDKAMNECEIMVTDCMNRLVRSNQDILDAYDVFYKKCESRVEKPELLCSLEKLRRAMQSNHAFVKGPFPIIEIPSEIEYSTMLSIDRKSVAAGKNGKKKNDSKKNRLCMKKSEVVKSEIENVKNKNTEQKDDQLEVTKLVETELKKEDGKSEVLKAEEKVDIANVIVIDEDNYALLIAKNIDRVLKIIQQNGTHYYTSLKNKEEHPSIGCKNQLCETQIHNALRKLNSIRDTAFEFWIENLNRFAELISAIQLPSIEYYLMDEFERENFLKNEGLASSRNDSMTLKINDKLSQFQNALSDMLDQLRSKSPTIISPCLEL